MSAQTTRAVDAMRPHTARFELSVTSLLDVMTILLFFLLKSYAADPTQLSTAPGLRLPNAANGEAPSEITTLIITTTSITVDDQRALALTSGRVDPAHVDGLVIRPLLAVLEEAVRHQERVAAVNPRASFAGAMTIVADRDVSFELLAQVLATARQADFRRWRFAVLRTE